MIVINKIARPHDSLGMITKVMKISALPHPSSVDFSPVSKISHGEGKKEYRKKYNQLTKLPLKRRNLGLSCKAFKTKGAYATALKIEIIHIDNMEHREFVKNQLIGGFAFDSENVFV